MVLLMFYVSYHNCLCSVTDYFKCMYYKLYQFPITKYTATSGTT